MNAWRSFQIEGHLEAARSIARLGWIPEKQEVVLWLHVTDMIWRIGEVREVLGWHQWERFAGLLYANIYCGYAPSSGASNPLKIFSGSVGIEVLPIPPEFDGAEPLEVSKRIRRRL